MSSVHHHSRAVPDDQRLGRRSHRWLIVRTVQPQQCATQCSCRCCTGCLPSLPPLPWPSTTRSGRERCHSRRPVQRFSICRTCGSGHSAAADAKAPTDGVSATRPPNRPPVRPGVLFSHWLPPLLRHFVRLTTSSSCASAAASANLPRFPRGCLLCDYLRPPQLGSGGGGGARARGPSPL